MNIWKYGVIIETAQFFAGGPGSSPGHGKHRKQSRLVESSLGAGAGAGTSGHRAETGPNDLRRIQEDQEFFEAINQSKKEEELRRMRGGGGTNVPLDNQVSCTLLKTLKTRAAK